MTQLYRKAGDTGEPLVVRLVNASDRRAVDLTGATATFMAVLQQPDGVLVPAVSAAATVEAEGTLRYDWQAGDLADPGLYLCSFVVTMGAVLGSVVETYPRKGFIEVSVETSI